MSKDHRINFLITDDEYNRLKYLVRNTKQSVTNSVYFLVCQYIKDSPIPDSKLEQFLVQEGIKSQSDSSPSLTEDMFK